MINIWNEFIKNKEKIKGGSRTPMVGTPSWVTLEVTEGGMLVCYY